VTIPLLGRRIALVGGAGFIGHNLALTLQALGARVEVIDGLEVNNLVAIAANVDRLPHRELYLHMIHERLHLLEEAGIPMHVQDARDYNALSRVLSHIAPEVVVQLAAVAHASRANKNPFNTFDHSFRTLENALDWSRDNTEHFVFFSSSMVYGNFEAESVTEDTPCDPLGIYGALKLGGERLVIAYHQVFDLDYTIVRPSALYGERCVSRRVGQAFIENALRGQELSINGDGEDRLDFTYVGDLVAGIVKVIEREEARNEIFNLTYGSSRSINGMAELVRENFPETKISYRPADQLMPERGTLDVSKAKSLLGYEPAYPLEKGYVQYIRWYQELATSNPHLFAVP
jgi:nucleoside-diphosphate-sugar epimerase